MHIVFGGSLSALEPSDVVGPLAFRGDERVLVTGGSGFIGTNLVDACLGAGICVAALDCQAPRNAAHAHVWSNVDLLDAPGLSAAVQDFAPTLICPLGARTDLHGRALADYSSNVAGVQALVDACNAVPTLRRVIFASSRLVCRIGYQPHGDTDYCPTTRYGESKVRGEQIVRAAEHRCDWLIVRPTSVWGPWFGVPYRDFFDAVSHGRYVHIRGVSVRKSFGFVGNTVYQLARLAYAHGLEGATIYLGDYPPTDVREMADLIRSEMGGSPHRSAPRWPLTVAARVGDVLQRCGWTEPPLTRFRLANLTTEMIYDLSPLEGAVGPLPFSLTDGVRLTSQWLDGQR